MKALPPLKSLFPLLAMTIFVLFSPLIHGEQSAEIYETYLPAQKLIPVIEPILNADDRITAYHNKLFIKASEDTHREILAVLEQIDRLPKNVLISIRYSDDIESAQTTTNDQIKVYRGTSQGKDVEVELMAKHRLSTRLDKADQKIKVLEGEQGVLTVGKDAAQNKWVLVNPFETRVTQEYRTVGSQLYVIPYLLKDERVRLEVFTKNQQFRGGSETETKKLEAQTVLLLEPGVWTPMAGSVQIKQSGDNSTTLSTHSDSTSSKTLLIKVDVLE
ncbi:hypothetical protein FT643_00480 [Ketobacter sp. MCCC 1A13808]|uniref:hypothetical protein n=1 Tax=Ketobacter sp. MCCC 1A13808 TaxID=2602738 RepID=UPI000F1337DA|nr:hypothetical protein [Ketobacter sp. MCCC 1A13808]MVF10606.1 hypothetical protein [Ketobacter sp. MCCC 1A13808]RLP56029.1 MAG: hypothetical protein D6160_01105 [Ketobacter sp.]